jgi:hypothetical protein
MGSKYCLHRAAGLLQYADENNIKVIMANGKALPEFKITFYAGNWSHSASRID